MITYAILHPACMIETVISSILSLFFIRLSSAPIKKIFDRRETNFSSVRQRIRAELILNKEQIQRIDCGFFFTIYEYKHRIDNLTIRVNNSPISINGRRYFFKLFHFVVVSSSDVTVKYQ